MVSPHFEPSDGLFNFLSFFGDIHTIVVKGENIVAVISGILQHFCLRICHQTNVQPLSKLKWLFSFNQALYNFFEYRRSSSHNVIIPKVDVWS